MLSLFTPKVKRTLRYAVAFLTVLVLSRNLVECGGDLGSIECVDGKWQIDTKIISLVIVCPVQISWKSLVCVFKRYGLYENGLINEDFHMFLCSLFWKRTLIEYCFVQFTNCLNLFGGVETLQLFIFPVSMCVLSSINSYTNCTI